MTEFPFPKAIIFDWDNTLVNTWPAITIALNKARAAYGLETWDVEEARLKSARALRVSFPEWFGDNWEDARDIFYESYNEEHTKSLEAIPGADSLLTFLKEEGIPAVIVSTKKNTLLNAEVDHMGWRSYFGAVIGSMDAPQDKPHHAPVDVALSLAGIEFKRKSIWFVGDSHADVECALRANCRPIIVNNAKESKRLGIKWSFSDCNALKKKLYSHSSSKVGARKYNLG